MFCKYCGAQIENTISRCPKCGKILKRKIRTPVYEPPNGDNYSIIGMILSVLGFTLLGLIFSIVGIAKMTKTSSVWLVSLSLIISILAFFGWTLFFIFFIGKYLIRLI